MHGRGEGGDRPLDWDPNFFFIARPKTYICKPPFACQNVLKLTHSNLEFKNFPGEDPRAPSSRGGEGRGREGGREEREGKGKRRREGKDKEGGEGREGTEEGRRGGMGGRGRKGRSTWAPPP